MQVACLPSQSASPLVPGLTHCSPFEAVCRALEQWRHALLQRHWPGGLRVLLGWALACMELKER